MYIFPKPVKAGEDAQRAFFCGKTRSGKTYAMLRGMQPFVGHTQIQILETKNDRGILGLNAPKVEKLSDINKYKFPDYPIVIYRPSGSEIHDKEVLDKWFEWIFMRGNTLAFVDECTQVVQGTTPLPGFLDVYTRGSSRGITTFLGNQIPNRIPKVIYSEAEHFYKFRLNDIRHRKILAEYSHPAMINQVRDPHGFHYYFNGGNRVYYVKSL